MRPETDYAKSGSVHLAFQMLGEGPPDLLFASSYAGHLEFGWEFPPWARYLRRLASFSRLIIFDRRGTGLSDRVHRPATFEESMDDVGAVLDAVGSRRAALFGETEGGPLCALYAATHPERTQALILYGSFAKGTGSADYPWAPDRVLHERILATLKEHWGREPFGADVVAPSLAHDESFRRWFVRAQRHGLPLGEVAAWYRLTMEIDIRSVLPTIRVPTLVIHRRDDRAVDVGGSRYIAQAIPGARYVELPGDDHYASVGDTDAILAEVSEFLTGARREAEPGPIFATVLFTDIVESTVLVSKLGDRRWRQLLEVHDDIVRAVIRRFSGLVINRTGDGFLATFDGPERAVRCAQTIVRDAKDAGLDIRAGLHAGECELIGDEISGLAVHIAARVVALAARGEVLVTQTVTELVTGSDLEFTIQGAQELKGVPGQWNLFVAAN